MLLVIPCFRFESFGSSVHFEDVIRKNPPLSYWPIDRMLFKSAKDGSSALARRNQKLEYRNPREYLARTGGKNAAKTSECFPTCEGYFVGDVLTGK
jgi:hypothetical protein